MTKQAPHMYIIIKCKTVPVFNCHAMKVQGKKVYFHTFLTSALQTGDWSAT